MGESPLLDETTERLRRALTLLEQREVGLVTWHDAVYAELFSLGMFLDAHGWTPMAALQTVGESDG